MINFSADQKDTKGDEAKGEAPLMNVAPPKGEAPPNLENP